MSYFTRETLSEQARVKKAVCANTGKTVQIGSARRLERGSVVERFVGSIANPIKQRHYDFLFFIHGIRKILVRVVKRSVAIKSYPIPFLQSVHDPALRPEDTLI